MATYRTIAASEVDPDSPVTSTLMGALADNPTAITEGATGAPRHVLKSIERLDAGTEVRSQRTQTLSTNATGEILHEVGIAQIGDINCYITSTETRTIYVTRSRSGSESTMSTTSGTTLSVDVSVLPGDLITFKTNTTAAPSTYVAQVRTDGANLWPAPTDAFYIRNNDV